jgi:glycine/D-amino acid oxidase-like deaminating enzyme
VIDRARDRVAVLGAGLLGCATALWLARRGVQVWLYDEADAPLTGAGRWNEGKIHLGCLYAADPSLATTRRLLPDGLAFRRLIETLLGEPVAPAMTQGDDIYLAHRESVVDADAMGAYLAAVMDLARGHPAAADYLVDLRDARVQRLSAAEFDASFDAATLRAGFRVPERSLDTNWVADRLLAVIAGEPGITLRLGRRVTAVTGNDDAPLHVHADVDDGTFAVVVNALWHGRAAIDAGRGLPPPPRLSHRYRVSLFGRGALPDDLPSAVVATGPFGDVKNYGGRAFYASWYPAGLLAEGNAVAPPPMPRPDAAAQAGIAARTLAALEPLIPAVAALRSLAPQVRGGWVYAAGEGALDDPASDLHRRDRIGGTRHGRYFSLDTGKYSVAPALALRVAEAIAPA